MSKFKSPISSEIIAFHLELCDVLSLLLEAAIVVCDAQGEFTTWLPSGLAFT